MPRSAWTDVDPRAWRVRCAAGYTRITVHHEGARCNVHTGVDSVARDLRAVLNGHRRRNYGDIGYHLIVDYAGRVWEGRSLAYEGAHVAAENENNVGVMFLGNFERQKPSRSQVASLVALTGLLREHYGIKKHRVYGHRDLGRSACPGDFLYAEVERLRA